MIEITTLAKTGGPLTKSITLQPDGTLRSDGSACVMDAGSAERACFVDLGAFARRIAALQSHEAIALGALRPDLPPRVQVTTKGRLARLNGDAAPDLIARTADHIDYRPGAPALALIDIDTKGMPPAVRARIETLGGFWPALVSVLPELERAGHVMRRSTSTGIIRTDTGEQMPGSNGLHVYILVRDGADVERFLRRLHDRCWLHGLGWLMVGAGGQILDRSLIDRTVCAPERLVFEGAPILDGLLSQDTASRAPTVTEGAALGTRAACLDLSIVEQATLRDRRADETRRLKPDAEKVRGAFLDYQAERIAKRTGVGLEAARRVAERHVAGSLLPPVVLPFDNTELQGCAVADVLADPDRFVGATLSDPLEGPSYGIGKAKIMRRPDGTLWVHSFAHGRTTYDLRHDAASVEAELRKGAPSGAADRLVRLLLAADLEADEEQRLRELAGELAGVKARPLAAKIKAALRDQQQARAKARRDSAAAARDKRLRLKAPPPDHERLPILGALDEVLRNVSDPEPPMRDLDGHPVEVRCRPPMALHELSAGGSNQAEPEKTRLPAPVLPLLTKHTKYTLAHEIERHIEFTEESQDGEVRPVALPPVFIEHYAAFRDSGLPRVGAVVTAPLVLPDGTLLAPEGLDRQRKLVFRVEPEMIAMLPKPHECGARAVVEALDYLANTWLVDVATDFSGKCVLIAMALTIIERVLLPERPAFFVTAGKRGGGKTTAITMLILAVTGKKPAAAAWSNNEDERRKAMLAYLAEGLPALVWDNIPLGTTIACPTLEKVLTTDAYTDRVLGESSSLTVPTHTIMSFTGNNIGPRGDMASRSLPARLDVDRPDPENREFVHADPVAWTLDNRGEILASLYTVLLGNPQLRPERAKPERTRFKRWWHLVGSSVEHAAATLVEHEGALPPEMRPRSPATLIDFQALFISSEAEDEETAGLAEALDILQSIWPGRAFQASDVVHFVENPMDGETDKASALRSYFGQPQNWRGHGSMTARSIGRRLTTILDAPVWVEEKTMKLVRNGGDGGKRASWFSVRTL